MQKLNRIIEQYGLTKYDNGTATAIAAGIEERTSSVGGQYTVQAGDTLYGISRKSGCKCGTNIISEWFINFISDSSWSIIIFRHASKTNKLYSSLTTVSTVCFFYC